MAKLDAYDAISIAEIIVYSPYLLISLYLGFRHGFERSAGWLFLIILSLVRLIGSSLLLATITYPDNIGLYVGWLTLNSLGLSPLILTLLALDGRVMDSISRNGGGAMIPNWCRRLINLLLIAAVVLVIVGGTYSDYIIADSGSYIEYNIEIKIGIGLMIGGYAICVAETLFVSSKYAQIERDERRILLAVSLALPFVLVRLIYSCIVVFGPQGTHSVWEYLAMEIITQMLAAGFCLIMGLTLTVRTKVPQSDKTVTDSDNLYSLKP